MARRLQDRPAARRRTRRCRHAEAGQIALYARLLGADLSGPDDPAGPRSGPRARCFAPSDPTDVAAALDRTGIEA
ncbi:hypothetical protein ACU4GR_07410 [Methylobacterium oryzae CBMB20]